MQVRRRSAAERAGVNVGDLVLAIDDVTTNNLTHQQMLELISHQRLALQLTLSRYVTIYAYVAWMLSLFLSLSLWDNPRLNLLFIAI